MTRNTRIFLGAFLASIPFWLFANTVSSGAQELLFWNNMADTQQASALSSLEDMKWLARPVIKQTAPSLELAAQSAVSVLIKTTGEEKTLFKKNEGESLPIASLSKLMTALVAARTFNPKDIITISREAVREEESFGLLKAGDAFFAKDLLYPMLIESSNDAAAAFALEIGKQPFADLMNLEAKRLELSKTRFTNYAGLDPDSPEEPVNLSSALDVARIVRELKDQYPDIFSILRVQELPLYDSRGWFHHDMINTNELLSFTSWPTKVLGGKTGWTPLAQGTLALVLESPKQKGYIINVVLGSPDRFSDMKRLVNWTYNSYAW
ncbi:MAG: D-alanyl-D-alanine carboxypeptidase [Candidatus Wildermuthbacteria bacterium]|nr:D-alanyl-D-alanine carboxypeptidase [Candidatus Wildermuthbacteria bacterium]